MPSEESWRAIVEASPDAVVCTDVRGRIQTFNPAAERLFGYRADEVVGRDVAILMTATDAAAHPGHIARVREGGAPAVLGVAGREVTGRHRDGRELPLRLSLGAPAQGGGFVGVLRDAALEVSAREALRARDAEYAAVVGAITEGIVVQRADGTIVTSNPAARRILGLTEDDVGGRTGHDPCWRAVREDGTGLPREEHPAMLALRTGTPVEGVVMGTDRGDGVRTWIEVSAYPIPLAGTDAPGVVSVLRDVTREREKRRRLEERERSLRLLAENSTDVVLRTLPDSRIAYASPAAARLLALDPEGLVGRRLEEVLHPDDAAMLPEWRARVDAAPGVTTVDLRVRRGDGDWEWCEATVRAVRGPEGTVVERQSAFRSIARRRRMTAALAESLGRYRALIDHLPGGAVLMYDHDLTVLLAEGPSIGALTYGDDGEGRYLPGLLPERDRDRAAAACNRVLRGETLHWREDLLGRVFDATMTPVWAAGRIAEGMVLAFDVTERAHLEAERAALHEIAQAVASDASPEVVLDLVASRIAALFDAVIASVMRLEPDGEMVVLASSPQEHRAVGPGARFPLLDAMSIGQAVRTGRPAAVTEWPEGPDPMLETLRRHGAVGAAAAPVIIRGRLWGGLGFVGSDPARLDEATAGGLGRFADLVATTIANAEERQRLELRAATDVLTGLANRATFDQRLHDELARAAAGGTPLSLVLFDADHFKRVNDTHGHLAGDRVLVAIADVLRGAARAGDLMARIGGEEFGWLMPGVDGEDARHAAERVRVALGAVDHGAAGRVTVSAGVAQALGDGDAVAGLLRRADEALYAAKRAGRDRVITWERAGREAAAG
ncbi:MAG: PAS domain S-box protein [Thermoleophilia bacterium]|nr:PAS domain S-box protein [Thermoleophilia bacterium]